MDEVTRLSGGIAEEQPRDAAALSDALRLADALERAEVGLAIDLDPTEDPALAGLVAIAHDMRGPIAQATDSQSFRSFHHRSRAAILYALEAHTVEARRAPVVTAFRPRASRLWFTLAGTAAAAAIGLSVLGGPGAGTAPGGENLTVASTTDELDRIAVALASIQQHSARGDNAPALLLRDVIEGSARMSNLIEQRPDVISREAVTAYQQAVQNGSQVLEGATAGPGAEGALAAAQRAAKDGAVVATRYLATKPTATPAATSTPAATATATGTPSATSTPAPTATATATGTSAATPTGTATPTATPKPDDDIIRR